MQAERLIVETDAQGQIKAMPPLPANQRLEAIFLVLEPANRGAARRTPHPDIAGKTRLLGDVLESVPAADWGHGS